MRIDVHAHHFAEDYLQCLDRMGSKTTGNARLAPGAKVTLDERIGLMNDAGIDMQVLSPGPQLPYFAKKDDAVAAARLGNDIFIDVVKKHNGRFSAFANVPLPHVDAAIEEMGRCLDRLGMVGVAVGCSVAGKHLDDPEFAPFWAELDQRKSYVKRLWFDTVNEHPAALRCACDSYGASRIMLGTDWPYLAGPKFKHCVTYVDESGLPKKEIEAILDMNAPALLGISK